MPGIKQLEEQGRALLADQKALVEDTSRPWSEKREEYDAREADIKAILEQHKAQKAVDTDPFGKLEDTGDAARDVAVKSLGEQVTDTDEFKSLPKGERFTQSFTAKTAATILESTIGVGGVIPTYQPGVVPTLFRRLTVADLMPSGTMSSASLIYVQETAVTNAAATVAEGGAKPLSDITLAQVTENAKKIATVAKMSDEMLQDVPYVASFINGRLVLFVQLAEEDQLLNGSGSGANLTGLLNRSGLQTAQAVGSDTRVDAIFKEITKIRANAFLEPDGIVVHPTDWQSIRLLKDSNGQYYGGGPFTGAYGNGSVGGDTNNVTAGSDQLWGVRVVVTPAIAAGTALVGAFSTATQVFRRTGITVEMTNSNEDDFKNNLVAVRAEERLALAVYRPGALGTVTGL
jgi:HK97 family phage major capsid protein